MNSYLLNKKFLLLIPSIFYVFCAAIFLNRPGINADELLFGNAAVGIPNGSVHIFKRFENFPLMLMTYIGALKSWLYYPVFKMFGVNYLSIRLPMIILTAFSVNFCTRILYKITSDLYTSIISGLVVASFPSLVFLTRTDQGPVAIEFFLKSLIFLKITQYAIQSDLRKLVWLPFLLGIGVFNKINFIWVVIGILVGAAVWLKPIFEAFKKSDSKGRFLYLLFIPVVPFLTYIFITGLSPGLNSVFIKDYSWAALLAKSKVSLAGLQDHYHGFGMLSLQYEQLSNKKLLSFLPFNLGYKLMSYFYIPVIFISLLAFLFPKPEKSRRLYIFWGIYTLVVLTLQFLVLFANASWHFFTIFPGGLFLFVLGLSYIFPRATKYLLLILIVFQINSLLIGYSTFAHETPKPVWSNKSLEVVNYLKNKPGSVVLLTWGLADQLATFNKTSEKDLNEISIFPDSLYDYKVPQVRDFLPNKSRLKKYLFSEVLSKHRPRTLYVYSSERNAYYLTVECFKELLKENGFEEKPEKKIYENGKLIFTISKLSKRN